MKDNRKKQAIVISGESGSGKTWNAKKAMKFITTIPAMIKGTFVPNAPIEEGKVSIEDQILQCNPLLEAFGNAKTVRNDNSSRFGKYVKIYFDVENDEILGAETINYLLEKSRLMRQTSEERCFHIFYYILNFIPEELAREVFMLKEDGS